MDYISYTRIENILNMSYRTCISCGGIDMTEIIINAIMHYVNCTREDAEAMHYGVKKVRNDYYSAFMEDGELVICENGFPIHKLILI